MAARPNKEMLRAQLRRELVGAKGERVLQRAETVAAVRALRMQPGAWRLIDIGEHRLG
jgi:hypothetical protein